MNAAVRTAVCLRALAASLLHQPLWWALLPSSLLVWIALNQAFSLGLTTSGIHQLSAAYEVAFGFGLVAVAVGLGNSRRLEPALQAAGPCARLAATATLAMGSAALVGACVIIPAHLARTWQPVAFDQRASGTALVLGWVHFAALAAAVGELPGLRARRAANGPASGASAVTAPLVAVTVALAGPLALDSVWPDSALPSALCDVAAPLRASFDLLPGGAHQSASIWSTLFWGALGVAMAVPPAFLRSPSPAAR